MTTQMQKYNLQQVNAIMFAGFEYLIPDDTINAFNFLTSQIGSSAFVNSNVFQKREAKEVIDDQTSGGDQGFKSDRRRKKGNRGMEVSN